MGLGFPPFRGGPFFYADQVGAKEIVAKLDVLADRFGERFQAADIPPSACRDRKALPRLGPRGRRTVGCRAHMGCLRARVREGPRYGGTPAVRGNRAVDCAYGE